MKPALIATALAALLAMVFFALPVFAALTAGGFQP